MPIATPESPAIAQRAPSPPEEAIRVCILAPSPDLVGGQARQAQRLLNGLTSDPRVVVGFIPHNPRLPGPLAVLQRIKLVRTLATSLYYWVLAAVRLPAYDVVHVFSASYYSYLFSVAPIVLLAKAYGKRVLIHYHSGEAEDHLRRWPRTTGPVMRRADAIVVPSGYLEDVFRRFGLKTRIIANVVDVAEPRFRVRDPVRPIFLSNRLHEPLYNVACALRAFAIVQQRYPMAELTVAGDGSLRAELQQLADSLGLQNTTFTGSVGPERMASLYDAADIYINATNIDNMPGSFIECLAYGLPIVSTDAGGIPYVVTHGRTALLVGLNDHEALAREALRLIEEPGLAARLATNGREEYGRYTWDAVREAWVEAYGELKRTRGPTGSR